MEVVEMVSDPKDFTWPIYIDVVDGKVSSIWYVNDYGQDRLLTEGEEYHVSYEQSRNHPEQSTETEKDETTNWLQPKVYTPKKEK